MRKVKFKKWIPIEYLKNEKGGHDRVNGTGCWESDFSNEGTFHQWASAYEDFETNAGNYTVALVEIPDGKMESVLPSNIQFIS